MLKTAFLGCAHIHTPGFVKQLQTRNDVAVKAVWDHDASRAARRAEEMKAQVVSEPAAILRDPEIGSVVVCSETDRHEELVKAAAAAKKHLFVEKPLGMGSGDAFRMARAIEEAGVLFQTGYFMRGNPAHQFLREQIRKGNFGKITRARGSNCHGGSLKGWFDAEWAWMADPERAGCGAFGDLGTHSLDILMWLLGDEVERATADIAVATGRYGKCDEFGEGILQFKNGPIVTLAAGWVDIDNPVSLLISGTEGHAHIHKGALFMRSDRIEGADGKTPWAELPEAWPHAFALFFDAIGGKQDVSLVKPREAAARNAVMEALYEGSKTRGWVAPKYA